MLVGCAALHPPYELSSARRVFIHSLKILSTVGPIKFATLHATFFEMTSENRTGTDHFGPAFRQAQPRRREFHGSLV